MKTNAGLVEWAIKSYKRGDWYLNGGYFDRIVTLDYIMEKARQYPKRYTPEYIERSKKAIGKYAGDCVCFVKAYIWTDENGKIRYPTDPKVKAETDINVDDAFEQSPLKGLISTIPEIPGICVYYQGHMGIYIGGGYVIEARGVDYGVVKTKLTSRDWTHWFYYPGIIYEEDDIMLKKGDKGVAVYDYQTVMKALGYNIGTWLDMYDKKTPNGCDGSFGSGMESITKEAQAKYKLPVTGMVDGALYGKLAVALMNLPDFKKELELALADVAKVKKEADALKVKVAQLELQLKDVPKLKADLATALSEQQRFMEELAVVETDRNVLTNTLENVKQQLNIAEQMKTEAEGKAKTYADELENLQKAFGMIRTFIGG